MQEWERNLNPYIPSGKYSSDYTWKIKKEPHKYYPEAWTSINKLKEMNMIAVSEKQEMMEGSAVFSNELYGIIWLWTTYTTSIKLRS